MGVGFPTTDRPPIRREQTAIITIKAAQKSLIFQVFPDREQRSGRRRRFDELRYCRRLPIAKAVPAHAASLGISRSINRKNRVLQALATRQGPLILRGLLESRP